ncbi:hypothetical protein ABT174_32600 [Streptomyces sparsogenes]|uniref:hypothetical protein n=1 Tax=Streptomyces sparsogenes TaxID=67365 RepID=UPI00332ECF35
MKRRLAGVLAVCALSTGAVLAGAGAAHAGVEKDPAAPRNCDVEYTVSYYSYKQLGYDDFHAALGAEKHYTQCIAAGGV